MKSYAVQPGVKVGFTFWVVRRYVRMIMRRRGLKVSSLPSAAAPSAPGAPCGAGGGVPGGGDAPDVFSKLLAFVVLRVTVVPVVSEVVFPDI